MLVSAQICGTFIEQLQAPVEEIGNLIDLLVDLAHIILSYNIEWFIDLHQSALGNLVYCSGFGDEFQQQARRRAKTSQDPEVIHYIEATLGKRTWQEFDTGEDLNLVVDLVRTERDFFPANYEIKWQNWAPGAKILTKGMGLSITTIKGLRKTR